MEFVDLKSFHPNNLDEEAYAKFIEKWAFTVEVQWQKSEDPKIHELYSKCKGRAGLKGLALVLGRINTTIEIEDNFSMENNKIFKIPAKFLKIYKQGVLGIEFLPTSCFQSCCSLILSAKSVKNICPLRSKVWCFSG